MKKKILLTILTLGIIGLLGGGGMALYIWFMPHRDVVSAEPDFIFLSSDFIEEYLDDPSAANIKYLSDDGDSKIVVLRGQVASVGQNQNGDQVVVLQETGAPFGVAFTFTAETNSSVAQLEPGQDVSIKGVVRAGPHRDDFLGVNSNAVVEKASLFQSEG